MNRMPKALSQKKHACRRMQERFGITLSSSDYNKLVGMIRHNGFDGNKAIFKERQSNRVSCWQLDYGGQNLSVVYDRHRKRIVTVLPPENHIDAILYKARHAG